MLIQLFYNFIINSHVYNYTTLSQYDYNPYIQIFLMSYNVLQSFYKNFKELKIIYYKICCKSHYKTILNNNFLQEQNYHNYMLYKVKLFLKQRYSIIIK